MSRWSDGLDRLKSILENGLTQIVSQTYYPMGLRADARSCIDHLYLRPSASPCKLDGQSCGHCRRRHDTIHGYNPANQILTRIRDNDTYAFTGYTSVDGATLTYDANGNLTSDGATRYAYDVENRLISTSGARAATLTYDPLGRLFQIFERW